MYYCESKKIPFRHSYPKKIGPHLSNEYVNKGKTGDSSANTMSKNLKIWILLVSQSSQLTENSP